MHRIPVLAALVSVLALAGCASGARTGVADRLALLEAHAGAPVGSIRHPGRFTGWSSVGSEALVLRTRVNEAWLLDLSGACPDLPYAHSIAITSNMNTVHVNFDKVRPLGGTPSMNIPCHIRQIRPLDVTAIRQAERDMREGGEVVDEPREDQSGDSGT